jgi:nucleosome binding factor SPN SPT16 subunit
MLFIFKEHYCIIQSITNIGYALAVEIRKIQEIFYVAEEIRQIQATRMFYWTVGTRQIQDIFMSL